MVIPWVFLGFLVIAGNCWRFLNESLVFHSFMYVFDHIYIYIYIYIYCQRKYGREEQRKRELEKDWRSGDNKAAHPTHVRSTLKVEEHS